MANAPLDCDLLVVGSGAAGLAAAVSAAHLGKRVILVEKDAVLGGATAWSGGWLWAPRNPLAQRAGIIEDIEQPRTYLRNELGEHYRPELVDAFLQHCPDMVAFFEQHTALQFVDGNGIPDMHGDTPGAASGGHQVIAAPYDGREVLELLPRLRKTMRETSFMGMPIMAGADLAAFLNMTRSPRALLNVIRRFTTHLYHLARYGRAMHLVNGVALVARLARSAQDLGVQMLESTPAQRLIIEDDNVCGAVVLHAGAEMTIRAKAVVLAAGGFPNDPERRKAMFPRDASGHDNLALPPASCSGDGLRLGESAGGHVAARRFAQAQAVAGATGWRQGEVVVAAGIAREHCFTPLGIVGKAAGSQYHRFGADSHLRTGMQHDSTAYVVVFDDQALRGGGFQHLHAQVLRRARQAGDQRHAIDQVHGTSVAGQVIQVGGETADHVQQRPG